MKTPRRIKAWLVTWEWAGDRAKRDDRVLAVLNSRISRTNAKDLVEFLYLTEYYTVSEKMACATRKERNPYRAQFEAIGPSHEPLTNRGHHPYLVTRLVSDLKVEAGSHP